MHPFVHSFNPAIAPPWEARTDFDAFADDRPGVLPAGRDAPGHPHRRDRRPADARHRRRDWPSPAAACGTGRRASASRSRASPCRGSSAIERDYARRRGEDGRARPADRHARHHGQGRHGQAGRRRWTTCAATNGTVRGGVADGGPPLARDIHLAEAILALSGTTNGEVAVAGWKALEQRTGVRAGRPGRGAHGRADHLRRHPGAAPRGDHLPGVVGQRDRRTALLAVRGQRRAEQAVAHADRADALLPRPRLDRTSTARRCRPTGRR